MRSQDHVHGGGVHANRLTVFLEEWIGLENVVLVELPILVMKDRGPFATHGALPVSQIEQELVVHHTLVTM